MNIDGFIANIEEEFEEIAPGSVKPETNLTDLIEFNSMNALVLINLAKMEYQVTLVISDLEKAKSVQELFTIIKNKKEED